MKIKINYEFENEKEYLSFLKKQVSSFSNINTEKQNVEETFTKTVIKPTKPFIQNASVKPTKENFVKVKAKTFDKEKRKYIINEDFEKEKSIRERKELLELLNLPNDFIFRNDKGQEVTHYSKRLYSVKKYLEIYKTLDLSKPIENPCKYFGIVDNHQMFKTFKILGMFFVIERLKKVCVVNKRGRKTKEVIEVTKENIELENIDLDKTEENNVSENIENKIIENNISEDEILQEQELEEEEDYLNFTKEEEYYINIVPEPDIPKKDLEKIAMIKYLKEKKEKEKEVKTPPQIFKNDL